MRHLHVLNNLRLVGKNICLKEVPGMEILRYKCPCCGYLTLEERSSWEICRLCNWEDDGQDDHHADEVWGGPNRDYSLSEARENFKKHYVMYRDKERIRTIDSMEVQTKINLMKAFEQLKEGHDSWEEIIECEDILDNIVHEETERFSNNVERNQDFIDLINSDNHEDVAKGLLALSLNADDHEFVQEILLRYCSHENPNIRGIAILGFGHMARIHRSINLSIVIPIIEEALKDESIFVKGHALSALDDINMFIINDN